MRSSALFPTALALCAACGTEGALRHSVFTPDCEEDDVACLQAGLDAPIAAGGVQALSINLDIPGTGTPSFKLLSADPSVVEVAGNQLRAQTPGVSALVLLTEDDLAVDFLHVWVETPDRIALQRDGEALSGTVELLPGDELLLAVAPYRGVNRLLGERSAEWITSSDAVAVLQDGNPRRRRLVARGPGSATLTVRAFERETSLDLVVLP